MPMDTREPTGLEAHALSAENASTPASALALLPLPSLSSGLTPQQIRGGLRLRRHNAYRGSELVVRQACLAQAACKASLRARERPTLDGVDSPYDVTTATQHCAVA